ncbi:MAG: hypothetical protein U1D41_10070 [Nitrosomonas sp.]|uniref:hypothetical protein n=1 Tax=Nitrosomonas sp. TaxID=42353 RepID=UPI002734A889|nr:hypothetical protein [Nitrosomonas sp.]MDP3662055.1 hypothetical protein [Nitrosomonas sp.]MDZ4106484.1 hypothetical protein [Nitrosomonas sp.]
MNELIYGINIEKIERITGEDQKVIKKWKKGTKGISEPSLRLLRLYLNGDASALLGDEWKGYRFKGNLLYIPEWKNGFPPHEIRALFWKCQKVWSLEREIELLKRELEKRNKEFDNLEVKTAFYRRQLVLESKLGMILQRSFI